MHRKWCSPELKGAPAFTYRVVTCGPLAIMLHFFHQLITGSVSEDGEPVNIWAGLQIADR